MQIKVIKANGAAEEYLHTKVIGTINNALGRIDQADMYIAEELAEVVTYYLYKRKDRHEVTSNEIFSIIKVVLTATGHEDAAIALSEYQFERKIKRSRIEVISIDIRQPADAELLVELEQSHIRSRWDKSRIVDDLVTIQNVPRQSARTIASMVEEKIFKVGITVVSASLIKQLVLGDSAAVLRAQQQLQSV